MDLLGERGKPGGAGFQPAVVRRLKTCATKETLTNCVTPKLAREEAVRGGAPGKVRVVSSDPDRSAQVADPLRAGGHQVEVVATGQAALDRADAGEIDVIALDIQSSGGNPFQTLRQLLASTTAMPPVLVIGPADAV